MSAQTRRFIDHMAALSRRGLDESARKAAKQLVRDGIAVAALGADQPGPSILTAHAVATGATPRCTIIATPHASSPAEAARANGGAMHVLDYEPMWNPANHSLSTTLPALLALAEWAASEPGVAPVTGEALLLTLAVGIETQARLRRATGQYEPKDLVFHPPGSVGPIGSAVACGLLLGLDDEKLAHAACIAASRTGTLLANVGSMTKALHCGQAAASGLESAMMAARGFTGDPDALFGPRGYGYAFCGHELDTDELLAELPDWHIVEPGPAFKFYPSQYGTHFVITAALAARAQLHEGEEIERIDILAPVMPYVNRPVPASGLAGKFSFQYTAIVALLDGRVNVASFSNDRRFAPDVEKLLQRITIHPDPAREGRFDRMTLDIDVTTASGRTVRGTCNGPPGIWGHPADPAMIEAKARDCLATVYGDEKAASLMQQLDGLENTDAPALAALIAGTRKM